MRVQDKLLNIAEAQKKVQALIEIHTQVMGAEAYEAICRGLQIPPMMTHEAYTNARMDLKFQHLSSLFNTWCKSRGLLYVFKWSPPKLAVKVQGGPSYDFGIPNEDTTIPIVDQLEHLLLNFSIYWSVV